MARKTVWLLLNVCGGITCSVVLFWLCALLYTRHTTQPEFYHPDEPGKITQILHNGRNFNHPQLMLETALLVTGWEPNPLHVFLRWLDLEGEPIPRTREDVGYAGRRASGYLAAGAVVLCAWAGFFGTRSWFGFLMGAVGAGFCPALYAHSKYLKEEPSLIFGIACVLLIGSLLCARRWHWPMLLILATALGAACGTAASGKYSGSVLLVPSVLLLILVTIGRWWLMPVLPMLLMAGALWSWTRINHLAIADWEAFRRGFDNEKLHAQTDHLGHLTMEMPNAFFVDAVWTEAMPHVKVLALAAPLLLLAQRARRGDRWPIHFGWWLMICGGVYLYALSYSVLPFYRYALPVTLMLYLLAALAVVWLARVIDLPPQWRGGAVATLLTLVIGLQAQRVADYDHQCANDSRDVLRQWAAGALPPFSRIVADGYTGLRGPGEAPPEYASRLRVISEFYAPNAGTIEELQRRGYNYVAVASSAYERFFSPYTRPVPNPDGSPDPRATETFNRRHQFYKTLFEKYPILWQYKAEHPMWTFTNPDITVFRIGEATPTRSRESR